MSKVFISYSHDSEEHKRRVRGLADQLCKSGIDCIIDQYEEAPYQGWPRWMEMNLEQSDFILVVCTHGYFVKTSVDASPGGKGVKWEGSIIGQEIYESEGKNERFIPVVFSRNDVCHIPRVLRSYTYYNVMDLMDYGKLYRRLINRNRKSKPQLDSVKPAEPIPATEMLVPKLSGVDHKCVNQNAKGSGIVQIAADNMGPVTINSRSGPRILRLPTPGTIGATPLLKQGITERFNKLGEERAKRFGSSAFSTMYSKFKRDFGIKNNKWTVIWDWASETADTIITYLDEKYANTIAGRIEAATSKGTRIPSKGQLFGREKELLEQVELEISSPEVKDILFRFFGVTSHTQLSQTQHWQWVLYLEKHVRELIGE